MALEVVGNLIGNRSTLCRPSAILVGNHHLEWFFPYMKNSVRGSKKTQQKHRPTIRAAAWFARVGSEATVNAGVKG